MKQEIRIGIAGVGNCAAALLQGLEFYRKQSATGRLLDGVMEEFIGGYGLAAIRVAAAFDVASDKVGKDVSEAIKSPNICVRHIVDTPACGVEVQPGPVLDGIGQTAAQFIEIHEGARVEPDVATVARALRNAEVDVLINYLPVGSRSGAEFYAQCAVEARCGFINAIPVSIGRDRRWRELFAAAKLPLIGDDVKSQVGATIVHRALVELFSARGYRLDETYQLNVGGNLDFVNMMSRDRLADKRKSKAQAITDVANRGEGLPESAFHISPSDYIPFLKDRKIAFIRLEGRGFAGAPIDIELRMTVEDSPNSAGVVVDAIRYAKFALDTGRGGYLSPVSAWLMKAPAHPLADSDARAATQRWMSDKQNDGAATQ